MKKILLLLYACCLSLPFALGQELRAPAYPLITHDPYFSIWSFGDTLNSAVTRHWTGAEQALVGMVKVDGTVYRILGRQPKAYRTLLPSSEEETYGFQYTETAPAPGWMNPQYDDSSWKTGSAPIGDDPAKAKTRWKSEDIWVRRTFSFDQPDFEKLYLKLRHDDNVEVYLNGEQIYTRNGWNNEFEFIPLHQALVNNLKKGKNVLAIHCANTAGGQWLDAGLLTDAPDQQKRPVLTGLQKSVQLNATQTIYNYVCGSVDVTVTFTSPLLLQDLELLARPVSYVSFKAKSNDKAKHDVQLYFGASTNVAVNTQEQEVTAQQYTAGKLAILKAGTQQQPVLQKKGDNVRIDWGYMYVAVPAAAKPVQYVSEAPQALLPFTSPETPAPTALKAGKNLVLSTMVPLGKVGSKTKEQVFLLGYDAQYAVQYFNQNLRPWWKQDTTQTIEKELAQAASKYKKVIQKCEAFDGQLYQNALKAGGKEYAELCELAYRQAVAAHTLVKSPGGELLFLSKENFSNGSINTVDITYPSAPLFLIYNPVLLEGMMNGIFYYSESGRWQKPFPAHDLGTYPIANGQTYGEDMPVEEAGNMLLLTGALARAEGNANYARKHWKTLTTWAEYLQESGFDPANQLSTDDFAGHLARNANLSVKAIEALATYGKLAGMLGEKDTEQKYTDLARQMAQKWMQLADAGDHYALAFGKEDTWSQKYNLVWDKVLDLNIFPASVREQEVRYYLTKQNTYGLPLDSRKTYTKSDWIIWTATLADNENDFQALLQPVWKYATETSSRIPISDWHETTDGKSVGFQARSVVGGYFMKLLEKKWQEKPAIK
ncbi:glutaminase family protein [Pontibacter liquoris]|uniref:glutaminase family protein n=1 Tax=Pontibacter liquoris TaxID=2905677 RepID=UPI001FA7D76C|nr:glutaminase family protein [Pontibacter liquoris]